MKKDGMMLQEDKSICDGVREAQKVMKIKVFITAIAIIFFLAIIIYLWLKVHEGDYRISIPTDMGYRWTLTVDKPSTLKVTEVDIKKMKSNYIFEAIKEGMVEITMERYFEGSDEVVERRVYHVTVYEDLSVVQTSVEREIVE